MPHTHRFRNISSLKTSVILPDANVLIYRFWPLINREDETSRQYRDAFNLLASQDTRMVVTMNIISEVTNRVFNHRWGDWNDKQLYLGLKPIDNYKRFRNSPEGLSIMNEIDDRVKNKVMKHVHVVGEKQFTDADALVLLVASKIDLSDKIIAATAKEYNYIIFTHDGDFLYSDADLLTSNGKIFRAQR